MKEILTKGFVIYITFVTKAVGIFFMLSGAVTLVPAALLAFKGQSDEKGLLLFFMLSASALCGGIGFVVFRYIPVILRRMLISRNVDTKSNKIPVN